ncbi:MAG: chemotaxis protein CheB [Treponemataceae bacterium]|nr:MAG: chemotaxis protein CheB [Treponemataceae bacterium]
MIKTLIVDDSALARTVIKDFLESDPAFQIIGEAENGLDGVRRARLLAPDLITMDIEMPVMNGFDAIVEIKKTMSTTIVVISSHDTAKMAYEATVKGAFEFYAKHILTSNINAEKRAQIFDTLKQITGIKSRTAAHNEAVNAPVIPPRQINGVVIASSTGGPKALIQLCASIPKDFPAPVVLVQHNTSGFDKSFAQWLNDHTRLEVCLAEKRMVPAKGKIYVAPTDKHLMLGRSGFLLDDGEPICNQKPSADALFKSAASIWGKAVISVVLTGMGSDGADGTRYIKRAGGITIAQDEATSLIYGMPRAAAETGCVDIVLPLDAIAAQLVYLSKGSGNN